MDLEEQPVYQMRPRSLPVCSWTGRGCFPQSTWTTPFHGTILVISLFDGIGGLLLALLALNVKFFYVAVECDEEATACIKANVSEIMCFKDVATFKFQDIRAQLKDREFDAILVAGGSPCQGNSSLNPKARGLKDPRSQMFYFAGPSRSNRVGTEARRADPSYGLA